MFTYGFQTYKLQVHLFTSTYLPSANQVKKIGLSLAMHDQESDNFLKNSLSTKFDKTELRTQGMHIHIDLMRSNQTLVLSVLKG